MEPAMDEDQEIDSSPSETLAIGLLRDEMRQVIQRIKKIQDEIVRMRGRINQLSQHIELEKSLRRNSEALHRRRMHTFMTKLRNLANDYLSDPDDEVP
jgi:predicted  nucleic acid-binding Zn-ribbon protein